MSDKMICPKCHDELMFNEPLFYFPYHCEGCDLSWEKKHVESYNEGFNTAINKYADENKQLKERLEIAVDALEIYANHDNWYKQSNSKNGFIKDLFHENRHGFILAQEALKKLEINK